MIIGSINQTHIIIINIYAKQQIIKKLLRAKDKEQLLNAV